MLSALAATPFPNEPVPPEGGAIDYGEGKGPDGRGRRVLCEV